jgi:energy-coupling factor transporter transmembrane protein EcfT
MKNTAKHHPVTWMVWSLSATVVALLTRNPWYLLLLALVAVLIRWVVTKERPGGWFLRIFLSLLITPTLLNLLFSRSGDTVLLELPIRWIGGPYTLEALVFGASAGVQIACLLTIMTLFSEQVSAQDLLRRTPSVLYPVGVTASISLTFVPHARRAYDALREAQQVRGYQPKGWRDLPKVVTPLVVLSLERAIAIAESLVSRGWGNQRLKGWHRAAVVTGLIGLAFSLGSWILFPSQGWVALLLVILSCTVLWFGSHVGNGSKRYHPDPWRRADSWMVLFSLCPLMVGIILAVISPVHLTYYPYPRVSIPEFQWTIALSILLFSAPLWFGRHD